MDKTTVGNLCKPYIGQLKLDDNTLIDYFDIASVDNIEKQITGYTTYKFAEAPSRARKKVEKGNILVSTVRPNLNAVALFDEETENMPVASTGFCVLECKANTSPRFLFRYLQSQSFVRAMVSQATGASYPAVSDKIVRDTKLPAYSYEEQIQIANVLDATANIISKRKHQLQKLDELVKARFVELFGDPERNPKKWPVISITEIIRGKVSNGFFAKRDAYRNDGNVQVLGVANIVNRMYSNIEGLPRTNATQAEKEKYRVKYGDMLFCRSSLVAEGIGKASIVPQDTPQNVLFECHVIRLPLDQQKCVPEFVQALSTTPYFRKQIIAQSKTATMTTIGQDGILKAAIILPPVELQQEFLRFVEQTDKSKVAVQKALDEAQLLFDSLMQKYFE